MSLDGIGIRTGLGPTVGRVRPDRPAIREPNQPPEPELRSLLSADELAYFADLERMGPVTYGPKAARQADAPPPALGQRIDVRA